MIWFIHDDSNLVSNYCKLFCIQVALVEFEQDNWQCFCFVSISGVIFGSVLGSAYPTSYLTAKLSWTWFSTVLATSEQTWRCRTTPHMLTGGNLLAEWCKYLCQNACRKTVTNPTRDRSLTNWFGSSWPCSMGTGKTGALRGFNITAMCSASVADWDRMMSLRLQPQHLLSSSCSHDHQFQLWAGGWSAPKQRSGTCHSPFLLPLVLEMIRWLMTRWSMSISIILTIFIIGVFMINHWWPMMLLSITRGVFSAMPQINLASWVCWPLSLSVRQLVWS